MHAAIGAIGLAMYPVGSIYLSVNSTNPGSIFGGTWQRLPNGAFIRNAGGNAGAVGTTQAEGLPNITGTFTCEAYGSDVVGTGALSNPGVYSTDGFRGGSNFTIKWGTLSFDASKSNGIYGNSQHVTPYNFCVYMWRRTA